MLAPPIRRVFRPSPVKHEYPRAMTIAIGILATDGFVIAADSEVSAGDYMHVQGQKVHGRMHFSNEGVEPGAIVVTGAGDDRYLESAYGDVAELLSATATLQELEVELARYIKTFYKEHVIPFSGDARPDFSLIIAARRGQNMRMWTTALNRLVPCRSFFTAVGAGEMYARGILRRLCGHQDVQVTKLVAAYVIHLVKDRIPRCGKQTHLLSINRSDPMTSSLTPRQLRLLGELFDDYEKFEGGLLHRLFGNPQIGDEGHIAEVLKILKSNIDHVINDPSSQ